MLCLESLTVSDRGQAQLIEQYRGNHIPNAMVPPMTGNIFVKKSMMHIVELHTLHAAFVRRKQPGLDINDRSDNVPIK